MDDFDPVAEAERVLDACNITPWRRKVAAETKRLGRAMTLAELLELSKGHRMSKEELEAQQASWVRGNIDWKD